MSLQVVLQRAIPGIYILCVELRTMHVYNGYDVARAYSWILTCAGHTVEVLYCTVTSGAPLVEVLVVQVGL